MKTWKNISTLNKDKAVRSYAKSEIEENLNNNKGYWKQSIVCKIAAYGYYDMKSAWRIFNILLSDVICELTPKKKYDWENAPESDYLDKYVNGCFVNRLNLV